MWGVSVGAAPLIWDWIVLIQKKNEFVTDDFNWLNDVWA